MLHCIHCHDPGIRPTAKRWSSREAPATCALCGKLSHVAASTGSGIPVATLLILIAFAIIGALGGHPLWGMICGLPCAVTYNICAWQKADMWPISPESVASARKVFWLVELLTVFGILGA